jgi:hypothetical protein
MPWVPQSPASVGELMTWEEAVYFESSLGRVGFWHLPYDFSPLGSFEVSFHYLLTSEFMD